MAIQKCKDLDVYNLSFEMAVKVFDMTKNFPDALGSSEETLTWLEFAYKADYITKKHFEDLTQQYTKLGAMLYKLMQNWQKF